MSRRPTLADLDAEMRLLGSLVASLVDDSVLNPARPETRRPKGRLSYPQHVPKVEAERRRALKADAVRCPVCGGLTAEPPTQAHPCLNCRWPL